MRQNTKLKFEIQVTIMNNKKIYALGFFDGVHLGHQALLRECLRMTREHNATPCAITFLQHPMSLFTTPPALINSDADREQLLRQYGIGPIYKLPVTEQVMSIPWQSFLEELLEYGAIGFVCGYDFRFGHKGEGNAEKLQAFCQERGLPCVIVTEQLLDGIRISSSHIRGLIQQGQMETATKFLGHPHILSGQVTHGRHLGRTIGVPTANILIPGDVVVPRLGVYACFCRVEDKTYRAVTNIGSRPTVGGHQTRAESWILDFSGDLYGKTVTLEFVTFLRPERKFDSLEELKEQIRHDADKVRDLLR